MKKYLLFSHAIVGMGGEQQFLFNKTQFLARKGWEPFVFSGHRGIVRISPLARFVPLIRRELMYPPCVFRKRFVEKAIAAILRAVGDVSEGVRVESTGVYSSQWAELLAQRLGAQHVVFSVEEQQNRRYSTDFLRFCSFKHDRRELFGINPASLHWLFRGFRDVPVSDEFAFSAVLGNVVDVSATSSPFPLPPSDFNIAGIWRTHKPGFLECMRALVPFLEHHADRTFNVVVIGSGNNPRTEEVAAHLFRRMPHVHFVVLGFVYPIPLGLLRQMDVFVSTAGSSRVPMRHGIPSISVTTEPASNGRGCVFLPLGILNYTTRNTVAPEHTGLSLDRLLEMVLFEKYCDTHPTLGMENIPLAGDSTLQCQLDKFGHVDKGYFDVLSIRPQLPWERQRHRVASLFGLIGLDALHFVKRFARPSARIPSCRNTPSEKGNAS